MRLRLLEIVISDKHTELNMKSLIYKSLIKPMRTRGLQLWGNAEKSNINNIQTVRNKILRSITDCPHYITNFALRSDLKIKTIRKTCFLFLTNRFHSLTLIHPVQTLARFLADPPRRFKRNWRRDFLDDCRMKVV